MIIPFHTGTETASGNSPTFATGNMGTVALFVNVTARSGTLPTLTVGIQHSPDGNVWYDFPNLTTTAINSVTSMSVMLPVSAPLSDYVRCVWTIGGITPSFTFTADLATYSL